MKMLLCRNKFTDKKIVYENIKALSKGIEHNEYKLKRKLYGATKKFVSEAWEVGWIDFVGYKRKERSDKAKRIEQMKRINLARATEQIKKHGTIVMNEQGRKKFKEEFIEAPKAIQQPKNDNPYYDTKNVDRDDYNQDIQPIEGTKQEKIEALRKLINSTK